MKHQSPIHSSRLLPGQQLHRLFLGLAPADEWLPEAAAARQRRRPLRTTQAMQLQPPEVPPQHYQPPPIDA